jgi:periplasmic copper chaperone A
MLRTLVPCGLAVALISLFNQAVAHVAFESRQASPGTTHPAPTLTILAQDESMDERAGHGGMAKNSFTVGDLVVEAPWARESVTRTGAAYMTLRNHGDQPDRLIGVSSDVAETVQLHSSVTEDGVMQMRSVETVEVPAHGEAVLEPGGVHVMLIGLEGPLKEGKSFPLTLRFEKAGEVEVTTTIEDIGYAGGGGHDHGHGG